MSDAFQHLVAWEHEITPALALPASSRWFWLPALCAHLGDGPLWAIVASGLLIWGDAYLRGLVLIGGAAVLGSTGISIRNPECCAKTFPDFFQRFEQMSGAG